MLNSISNLFRNAYGGLSRPVWWLALTLFINRSGTMVIIFLSLYLKQELHFSLENVGVIMAMFGAGAMLGAFIGGRIIDKTGYYPVMLCSLLSGGIMFIVLGQLHDYFLLCVGFFILGVFGESFRPANMAAVSHYSTTSNYTRSISLNRLAINLGVSVGPALGGFLASYNYKLIFWVDGLTSIAAAIVVVFFLKHKHNAAVLMSENREYKKPNSPYRDKIYMLFLPLVCLYAISFLQFFTTMPLYYKQVEHFSEARIGWIIALNGALVAGIEMILIYKIEKRWSSTNFIALGASLLVISYLALLFVNGLWWLIMITVVISFSEMFAMPFMNTFMNERSLAANKGQYASFYVMSWSAAQVTTPIIATQVIANSGYSALWIMLAIFSFLMLAGIKILERFNARPANSF